MSRFSKSCGLEARVAYMWRNILFFLNLGVGLYSGALYILGITVITVYAEHVTKEMVFSSVVVR